MAASDHASDILVAEAATQIVLQKLDILLSHPVCVECVWMRACAKDAKVKLARIQEFISAQSRPPKITEWSGRLLRALYHAEEFIDKFHFRETRDRKEALRVAAWPLPALVSKHKLWRDLSMLMNNLEELCDAMFLKEAKDKRKNEPPSCSSHASVQWQGKKLARLTSFWDRRAPTLFSCHEKQKQDLMKWIKDTRESPIIQGTSILGEEGTGKTFFARWVYSQAKYMGYEWRAWVRVSASMDKQEILFEILRQVENLAGKVKDMGLKEMEELLCKFAVTKRFLLVLDDVKLSNEPLLQGLPKIIPFQSRGHIITTTQDSRIAQLMTFWQSPIKLENLGDQDGQRMLAWKLYGVTNHERLSKKEKDILKMCHGLPLLISLLGGFLSNAGKQEQGTLAKDGSITTLSGILQLSCHKLPAHLKPCFIYLALFPGAFPIPTRRLVRLWLAEGFLDSHCSDIESKRTRQPEDVGETFILELAHRNVIDVVSWRADGSPKACQMLTSLYDMIRPIVMKTRLLYLHATGKSKDVNDLDPTSQQRQPSALPKERMKIWWLAEHTNIVTDSGSGNYPNFNLGSIRSFLSFYLRRGIITKEINTFLRKMTSETNCSLLRVLDLEGVYKPSLQGVLRKLVLLRYLGLRSTVMDSIPHDVADLYHLETLDIKHTNITSLPNSLWKARNLRHLHLNWFYIDLKTILKAYRNNAMALTKLQTLSGLVIGEVKENLKATPLDSLTSLTRLKLFLQHSGTDTSGAAGETVADWISSRLTNLQSLTFGAIQEARPTKEDEPPREAESTEEDNPVGGAKPVEGKETVEGAGLTKEGKRAKKAKPTSSQVGPLPKLSLAGQHHNLLELYLLGQLSKPIWTDLLPGSLRVLTLSGLKVEIDMMPELGRLLIHLRTFRLLANSFLGNRLTFVKNGFPSLMIFKIWKLPNLKTVTIEPGAMPHLKELELRRLDMMNNVEGIDECKELENIHLVVRKGPDNFVRHFESRIGEMELLYQREDTERLEAPDDEDDRDETIEILYRYTKKEKPQSVDGDSRSEKGEHVGKERTQSADTDNNRNEKEEMSSTQVEKPKTQSADDDDSSEDDENASP